MKKRIATLLRDFAERLNPSSPSAPAPFTSPFKIELYNYNRMMLYMRVDGKRLKEIYYKKSQESHTSGTPGSHTLYHACIEEAKEEITQGIIQNFAKSIREDHLIDFQIGDTPFEVRGALFFYKKERSDI